MFSGIHGIKTTINWITLQILHTEYQLIVRSGQKPI